MFVCEKVRQTDGKISPLVLIATWIQIQRDKILLNLSLWPAKCCFQKLLRSLHLSFARFSGWNDGDVLAGLMKEEGEWGMNQKMGDGDEA